MGQGNASLQLARAASLCRPIAAGCGQCGIWKIQNGRGNAMLDRLSVNAILRSVIAALGAVVVIMLAAGAWSSWSRLQVDTKIAGVASTTAHIFTALHNLRSDRSRSFRMLTGDEVITTRDPRLCGSRDDVMT